jgi:hypothetical protein
MDPIAALRLLQGDIIENKFAIVPPITCDKYNKAPSQGQGEREMPAFAGMTK